MVFLLNVIQTTYTYYLSIKGCVPRNNKTGTMSSSSTSPQWKPDVFVSFGEDDVRKTFIADLFKRLNQVGINYFEDDNREGARQTMAKCPKAIHEVRFALIVFSTNYVNSSPCLDELVEILNCERDPELVVIPIFYIDRAKVLEAASKGRFKEALGKVIKEEKRRSTLANGLANGSSESELIDKIVERLVNQIHSRYSGKDFTFGPFGGKGQNDWHTVAIAAIHGQKNDRKGITVEYGEFIKSVTFEVDEDTPTVPQNNGKSIFKVKLRNREYVSSFAGHFKKTETGGIGIKSLTFRTNKRILGPINREKEKKKEEQNKKKKKEEEEEQYFYVPSKAGEVVELYWRTNNGFLESIGASVMLHSEKINLFKSVGLFGLARGSKWGYEFYDSPRTNVRNIIVEVDSSGERLIRSIAFQFGEENKKNLPFEKHGGNGGNEASFELGQGEYLTSISGYYTDVGIRSLTFETNENQTKTMGDEKGGTRFSSPRNGKIVGFYGWSDEYLRGIGAYVEPEPFGVEDDWNKKGLYGVREIHILPQTNIRSIGFVYDNGSEEGSIYRYCTKGVSPEEEKIVPIKLDYPREYLTSVSVSKQEDGAIQALTFYSNKKGSAGIYGPYGKATAEHFLYPSIGSRIIGFYVTGGKALKSLGVYAEPIPHMYPCKTIGPFGGSGGEEWDDGVHSDVRGFRVISSEHRPGPTSEIKSITFMYDNNGSLVEGSPHGGEGASSGEWKMLDYPHERLTEINGFVKRIGTDTTNTTIHDLKIVTTCATYHYAYTGHSDDVRRQSTGFNIPEKSDDGGRIVGFFGRKGNSNLISIGAHLEYNKLD